MNDTTNPLDEDVMVIVDTPVTVKRVEILRRGNDTPEVHYAEGFGYRQELDRVALYTSLYPRLAYCRVLDVSDAVDLIVTDVPRSEVPDVDAATVGNADFRYLNAARARATLFGYHKTLDSEEFEKLVTRDATKPGLRIVVDTVLKD